MLVESEVIVPRNWDIETQGQFSRLFTWRDSWIDNDRFFRLNYPNPIDTSDAELRQPDRFCTLIAGNKLSSHPLELYSKRRQAIRWFERHHPEEFDLYGVGWDLLVLGGPRPLRALNVLLPEAARRLLAPRFPSYRGHYQGEEGSAEPVPLHDLLRERSRSIGIHHGKALRLSARRNDPDLLGRAERH